MIKEHSGCFRCDYRPQNPVPIRENLASNYFLFKFIAFELKRLFIYSKFLCKLLDDCRIILISHNDILELLKLFFIQFFRYQVDSGEVSNVFIFKYVLLNDTVVRVSRDLVVKVTLIHEVCDVKRYEVVPTVLKINELNLLLSLER